MIDAAVSIQSVVPPAELHSVQAQVPAVPASVPASPSPESAPTGIQSGSAISIELSPAAEARLLKSEGQTVPEIAQKLRLPEDSVSSYLDLLV